MARGSVLDTEMGRWGAIVLFYGSRMGICMFSWSP
jgi:hypothetical protein